MLFSKGTTRIEKGAQPLDISILNRYGLDIQEAITGVDHDYDVLPVQISSTECIENIVAYMAGYVTKMCSKRIKCDTCMDALIDEKDGSMRQNLRLLQRKDRGSTIQFTCSNINYLYLTF